MCVQNFNGIGLIVAEIKQYHFACRNEGQSQGQPRSLLIMVRESIVIHQLNMIWYGGIHLSSHFKCWIHDFKNTTCILL